jgi:glycosyltransferase involved in cell wall biosynthesis
MIRKKRVVIEASGILPGQGPYLAGVARTTLELIRAALDLQPEFEIVLFSQRLRGRRLGDYGFDAKCVHLPLPRLSGIEWIKRHFGVVETMCHGDLYHAPANYASLKCLDRTIVTLHDAMFLTYPEAFLGHGEMASTVPPFVRKCQAVITPSQHSKTDIVERIGVPPERVHVIPWGTNHDLFRPDTDEASLRARLEQTLGLGRPFFLSVSCDIGRKNSERLLNVYAGMVKEGVRNDLVLVWPKAPQRVLDMCRGVMLADRVHILGAQPNEMLRDLYCGATVMAYPSIYEGFGLPILEAMACGTAVITSRLSSMPEVGGDAAVYVDPMENSSILAALRDFDDDAGDKGLRDRCIAQAAQFTWARAGKATLDVYRRYLDA